MDRFDDIRPYRDDEVREVLARLLADDEFIGVIARLRLPRGSRYVPWLVRPLVRFMIGRQVAGAHDVKSFQALVKHYMDRMVETTTSGFTVSGLDALGKDSPYLFISNHRDIALDPAFVNYALYHNGRDTVRIAIGDNLLSKPFASDLMRLNKSFIVKRSAKAPRQMLAATKHLSAYIRHSIEVDRSPIWLAQREGRAKDGRDRTEPAIIKMLAMSMDRHAESLGQHVQRLRIVPVAISYEFDPCDAAKARELHLRTASGSYAKAAHEDLASIGAGIAGHKGNVHVAFGRPLEGEFADADDVAQAIDRQIFGLYVLHPTNFFAWHALHGSYPVLPCGAEARAFDPAHYAAEKRAFDARIAQIPEAQRAIALGIYANVVAAKLAAA